MLLLLNYIIITGFAALSQSTTHYQRKDSSFCLHVRKSSRIKDVRWTFNKKFVVVDKAVVANYTKNMHFNANNYSLCINKLKETDSGSYKASIMDSDLEETSETYQLIVQAPVPKPVIRMSLGSHHSNLSAGICELAVNCSVLDDWLLALCSQDSCKTFERFGSKVNITVSAHSRSVVCSGRNHVSVYNASENMEETCSAKLKIKEETSPPFSGMMIVITVVLGVIIFAFIACLAVGLCLAKYHRRQTSTVQLLQNQQVEPHPPPATRDSTSSSQHEASYENVDVTQPPMSSPSANPHEELESKQSQAVDTVYSVLQLPRVNDSQGKSDGGSSTKDHEVIEVTSASESGEAARQMQVDTVYSMVQKPKT